MATYKRNATLVDQRYHVNNLPAILFAPLYSIAPIYFRIHFL